MTRVYLAYGSSSDETLRRHAGGAPVHLLVAYPALKSFLAKRSKFNVASWCLDSGAFSVFNSGRKIDVRDYISAARDSDACEVFGLDVIGDEAATRRNVELQWAAGVRAIPTWHAGSSGEALAWCAAHSDKIALGGVAKMGRGRYAVAAQVFARVWPKKVHGFGMSSWDSVRAAPFHSVDASSWCFAPSAMGMWAGYTGKQMSLKCRGVKDFWVEVEEHVRREKWAAFRWRKELAALAAGGAR